MRVSFFLPVFGVCLIVLLGACNNLPSASAAKTDYNRNYDFSNVHKVAIQQITRDTVETMMVSDVQIIDINEALTAELQRRGFQVVTGNSYADIFLAWRFVPDERATVSTFDTATQKMTEGMLYVDMIDPVILQTVWRATFRARLPDQSDSEAAAEYSREAVAAILAQFPPSPIER